MRTVLYYAYYVYSVPVHDFLTGELLYKRTRKGHRRVVAHSLDEAIHRTRVKTVAKFGAGVEMTIFSMMYYDHDTQAWHKLEIEPC